MVEVPPGIAPAGTLRSGQAGRPVPLLPGTRHAHRRRPLPGPPVALRLGLRDGYVLLAGGRRPRSSGPTIKPIEKLIAWAKKTYPINPRRVYMFGKGEGGKISAEFTMTHPNS